MTQYSRLALALLCAGALFQADAYAKVEVATQHEAPAQTRLEGGAGKVQAVSWNQSGLTGDNGDGIARASDAAPARRRTTEPQPVESNASYALLLGAIGALLVFGRRRRDDERWRTIKVEPRA